MNLFELPPITPKILTLTEKIGELVGVLEVSYSGSISPLLKRENQIKTIQASLEIEGNSLNIKQVTAVLDGKAVMAPPQDILEVKNAISAYQKMPTWNANSEQDLLDAHQILIQGLIADSGKYRQGSVGVSKGE